MLVLACVTKLKNRIKTPIQDTISFFHLKMIKFKRLTTRKYLFRYKRACSYQLFSNQPILKE